MYKPDSKTRTAMRASLENCTRAAYVYRDGIAIHELRRVKLDKHTIIDAKICHLFPCSIIITGERSDEDWQPEPDPIDRVILHNAYRAYYGIESIRVSTCKNKNGVAIRHFCLSDSNGIFHQSVRIKYVLSDDVTVTFKSEQTGCPDSITNHASWQCDNNETVIMHDPQ